jgi:neutral amino acid transport system substrate-binding protein
MSVKSSSDLMISWVFKSVQVCSSLSFWQSISGDCNGLIARMTEPCVAEPCVAEPCVTEPCLTEPGWCRGVQFNFMKKQQSTNMINLRTACSVAIATLTAGVLTAACQTGGTSTSSSPSAASPAGEGGSATKGAVETKTIGDGKGLKVGVLLPSTGDLASIGQGMIQTMPILAETVNACGGVNGAPVTLVTVDDQTDPAAGTEGMTKLVEADKVHAVVGSFASSVSTAAVDIAVRNKLLLISPGSTSPVFTDRAKKGDFKGGGQVNYWARTAPPDDYQAQALAKLAKEKGFTKVSTVVINNDYGKGFEKKFVEAFKKEGGTILNESSPTRYDPKGTTFDTEAAAAFKPNNEKPDAVVAVLYAETGSILLKSAYEQGLAEGVQVMLTDGVQSDDFPKDVGKGPNDKFLLAGAIGTVPGAGGKSLETFNTMWKEKAKADPGAFAAHTWDAGALVMLAAQAAKSNDREAIAAKLQEVASGGEAVTDVCEGLKLLKEGKDIDFQGASSDVEIDDSGDVVGNYDVWTVGDDGKIKVTGQVKLQ